MTQTTIDMSSRFLNRQLMVSDEVVEVLNAQGGRMHIEDLSAETQLMWSEVSAGKRKPYRMEGSVAIIPINGTLYHKVDWAGYSYTGYDWLVRNIEFAERDPDVRGVVFDINSGGGEVAGAFETAARIRQLGEVKPTLAIIDNAAYSAAYLMASATKRIAAPPAGGAGSIGVVTTHVDVSEMMSEMGYKLTFFYKGKHKVDGNPYQPLPESVAKRIDAKLDTPYNLFVNAVANYRSMNPQAVRDTEAQTYGAEEAKSLGLVDIVTSPQEALASFVAELNGKNWSSTMTANATEQATTNADKSGNDMVNQQALDAARAEGTKLGADQERSRIMGILKCEEAKGREALAVVLCEQGSTVDQAKAILAASAPAATTTGSKDHFKEAMDKSKHPEVGADTSSSDAEAPAWKKAVLAYAKATGEDASKLIN